MTIARAVAGVLLMGIGTGLAASPEIGGWITVGFCLFVAGAALAAGAVADVIGVD